MKIGYTPKILLIFAWGVMPLAAQSYDLDLAAAETGLSPLLIKAVALEESRRTGAGHSGDQPWAWTLNADRRSLYFDSREEAETALRELYRTGMRSIDVGLFQVNIRWNGDLVADPVDLLDPAVNLWAFTQVILECRMRVANDIRSILACYHAGRDDRPHGIEYAHRVINRYRSLRLGFQP